MKKVKNAAVAAMGVAFIILLVSCGGGGGGSSPTSCVNVAGTWSTEENVDAANCEEGTYVEYNSYTVTQSGCDIDVMRSGLTFNGTVDGNIISWTGSFPEDGGTTTITSLHLTVNSSATSFSGTSDWRWSDSSSICTGDTIISGTKQ